MNKKKGNNKTPALRLPMNYDKSKYADDDEIGLPENTRVVFSEESNPHDG